MLSKNVNNKKCAPELLFFIEKKIEKDSNDFWHRKLTLKVKLWHILTPPHYTNSQNSIISFEYVDFLAKLFPILYPPLENSTTRIAIAYTNLAFKEGNISSTFPERSQEVTTVFFKEKFSTVLGMLSTRKI